MSDVRRNQIGPCFFKQIAQDAVLSLKRLHRTRRGKSRLSLDGRGRKMIVHEEFTNTAVRTKHNAFGIREMSRSIRSCLTMSGGNGERADLRCLVFWSQRPC